MNEARPFASLSSGLLARKGAAKPAMRPHSYTGFEDLGWNDMGEAPVAEAPQPEPAEHVPSSIAALTPSPKPAREEPSVVAQQRAIAESFDGEDEPEANEHDEEPSEIEPVEVAKVVALPKRTPVPAGRKAAFTLRLDPERHLRLRLACAVTGRSAQQIVTSAVDELLAGIPEIETLAKRVPAAGAKRS